VYILLKDILLHAWHPGLVSTAEHKPVLLPVIVLHPLEPVIRGSSLSLTQTGVDNPVEEEVRCINTKGGLSPQSPFASISPLVDVSFVPLLSIPSPTAFVHDVQHRASPSSSQVAI
jgi:hypothetical protein